jgi:DtxR family Mn-dependent transcriptional regulator
MGDPGIVLVAFLALIAFFILIFWPEKGLAAKWKRSKRSNRRILMEDALKHIYECEHNKLSSTFQSLAGALSVKPDKVAKLLVSLESLKLITRDNIDIKLSLEGRAYALKIIRIHRLWERYLAEETSLPETVWHSEAEKQEHKFTEEQANEISRRLGYPRYDPHGDPIPTSTGDLPPSEGIPLTKLSKGEMSKVIHIEDEPEYIYKEIISHGIHLGKQIELIQYFPNKIHILADGQEVKLTPLIAANITVSKISYDQMVDTTYDTLLSLHAGEQGKVVTISRACRGQQRRRLLDLGVVPGTIISKELQSLTGNPVAYNIRGTMIAIRNEQAKFILIESVGKAN